MCIALFEGHTAPVGGGRYVNNGLFLSWSQDTKLDTTLRLWDENGNPVGVFYADAPITASPFVLSDKQTVVSGDSNGRILFLRIVQNGH